MRGHAVDAPDELRGAGVGVGAGGAGWKGGKGKNHLRKSTVRVTGMSLCQLCRGSG